MLWKKIKTQKTNQCKETQHPDLQTQTKKEQTMMKKIQNNLIGLPTKKQVTIHILGQDEGLLASNEINIKCSEIKKQYILQNEQLGKVTETLYIQNEVSASSKKQPEPMRRVMSYDSNILGNDMKQKQQVELNGVYNNYQAHPLKSQMPYNFVNQPQQKYQSKSLFIGDMSKKKKKQPDDPFLCYQLQSQIPEQLSHNEQHSSKTQKNKYSDNSFHKKFDKSGSDQDKDNKQIDDFFKQLQMGGFEIDEVQVERSVVQEIDQVVENTERLKKNKEPQNKPTDNQKTQSNRSQRTVSKKQISFQVGYKEQIRKKLKNFIIYISDMRQQICNLYEIINYFNEWIIEHTSNTKKNLTYLMNQISNKKRGQTNEQNKIIEQLRFQILRMEGELLEKQTINRENQQVIQQLKSKNQELTQNIFDINQKAAQCDLLIQKKVQLFKASYSPQKSENNPIIADNIKKLNEEVEELTKLYEQSQEQNKRIKQTEMQQIKQQMDKLILKQKSIVERQLSLHQNLQKFQEESFKFHLEKQKLFKKQKQLDSLERNLADKLFKIQQLDTQLSNGLNYVQERKRQNQQIAEKLQFQKQEFLRSLQENEKRVKKYDISQAQYSFQYRDLKNKNRPWDLYKSTQKNSQPNLVFETKNHKAAYRLNSVMHTEHNHQFSQQQNNDEEFRFFRSQQLIKNINLSPTHHKSMHKYNSLKFNGGFSKHQKNQKEENQKMIYVPKKIHLKTQRLQSPSKIQVDLVRQPEVYRSNLNLFKSSPPKNLLRINQSKIDRSRIRSRNKKQPFQSTSKLDALDTKIFALKNEIQKEISAAKSR